MQGEQYAQVRDVNYQECITSVVRDLGTAVPHIQVLKMIAWLFDTPLSAVRADCQTIWGRQRRMENNRGGD